MAKNRIIIDEIIKLMSENAIYNSRGLETEKNDARLTELLDLYPQEYNQAYKIVKNKYNL